MTYWISHDRAEETPEAKARWFQSLSVQERIEIFTAFTNLILSINPDVADKRDVRSVTGRIQILRKA